MADDAAPTAVPVSSTVSDTVPQPAGRPEASGAFDPQKLLRIAGLTREMVEGTRRVQADERTTQYLREVLDRVCQELREALPDELYRELDELTPDLREGSFIEELTLANAEILGWLQGLFQGTQLAIQLHALQQHKAAPDPDPDPRREPEPNASDSQYL